jgi:hypothetical protein
MLKHAFGQKDTKLMMKVLRTMVAIEVFFNFFGLKIFYFGIEDCFCQFFLKVMQFSEIILHSCFTRNLCTSCSYIVLIVLLFFFK